MPSVVEVFNPEGTATFGRTKMPNNKKISHGKPLRCAWANGEQLIRYHDEEWGVPVHDDRTLFEFLILEGAQAGLSWSTILNKRDNYRRAFDRFDPKRVARYDQRKIKQLLADPGIVRNKLKIASSVENAKSFLRVQEEFGSFDHYIWQFVGGKPRINHVKSMGKIPARTRESDAMSKDLKRRGFKFVGFDDLLRLHAGGRNGKRPRHELLSLPGALALVSTGESMKARGRLQAGSRNLRLLFNLSLTNHARGQKDYDQSQQEHRSFHARGPHMQRIKLYASGVVEGNGGEVTHRGT